MQQNRPLLLAIWREACRHIDIAESTQTIARLLAPEMPLAQLVVRRFDADPPSMVTVAAAPARADSPLADHRREFAEEEYRRLTKWCAGGRLLHSRTGPSSILAQLLPPDLPGDLIAAPLGVAGGAQGVLLLASRPSEPFGNAHRELAERLREPFSVALENDHRLHEIARLRAAAEAEKGALLRRLGRTDLGDSIIGEQSGLRQVMDRVALVAHSNVPVLILGETGTGKELVARALHLRGARPTGPFIRINCGAIPPELIDSQLFGHEKGSFTGADQTRQGWFERADGGTLFLDEVGELPLEAQVRFLRVLQDGFVERVGSAHPIHVDVRVVAATHRDLAAMVREGRFREDLWYRLAVFPLLLPPLRDRRQDIRDLAHHFAERAAARFTLSPCIPTESDIELLQSYGWPGNIRELGAVIDRAAILGDGKGLEIAKALGAIDGRTAPAGAVASENTATPGDLAAAFPSLDAAMRSHIEAALRRAGGRIEGRRGAAALLQINPHTLRARMRKLGIAWSNFREQP